MCAIQSAVMLSLVEASLPEAPALHRTSKLTVEPAVTF